MEICKVCGKEFRSKPNLELHMNAFHKEETAVTKEDIIGHVKEQENEIEIQYFCESCESKINENQKFCPNCGTSLNWEGII